MTQTRITLPSKTFREDNIKALYVGINYQVEAGKRRWLPMVISQRDRSLYLKQTKDKIQVNQYLNLIINRSLKLSLEDKSRKKSSELE